MRTKANWHIAQLNVGRIIAPTDSPVLADFHGRARPNQRSRRGRARLCLALSQARQRQRDRCPDQPDPLFSHQHVRLGSMDARANWPIGRVTPPSWCDAENGSSGRRMPTRCCGGCPAGYRPSPQEAPARLDHLRVHGPSPYAFTFKQHYPPPYEVLHAPPLIRNPSPIASAGPEVGRHCLGVGRTPRAVFLPNYVDLWATWRNDTPSN